VVGSLGEAFAALAGSASEANMSGSGVPG